MPNPLLKSGRRRPIRGGRDTREEILVAAEELLLRRGFNGFSYQHIAVRLGIRNAAIHYHFPTKEDLGVALVRRYRLRFLAWTDEAAQCASAFDRLVAYFQTYVDHLDGRLQICPVGIFGAEFDAIPDRMQREAQMMMRDVYEWMVRTLHDGLGDRSVVFSGDAHDKAMEMAAAMQGALQFASIAGRERFEQVFRQITLELRPASAAGDTGPAIAA
ncbi:transcriptional regulator, TetR family [Hydrocarboniphaga daqingensis]|uniref:Transcriptional regulator, TetR family n=1 Tax=Hydrocarboniphaga daqingensis TaxID=490188 RepID=A0A1M5Q2F5_9GAMM|nr:TetR/AcrR family transcriptional regulator [Hydrocarboniphaga daqingensis]SHH07663.1 transcriptional regulator, TetR family [Hydrocarboniphaga daqingensis]